MSRTVIVAGGGTAGHVVPAIAVAQELCRLDAEVEPVFVGVADRLEATLVPEAGFRLREIAAVAVPRRPSPALLRLPAALRRAVREAEAVLSEERAQAVVTFGGYVAFPVDRAAERAQLPLVIHEQNAIPGLANRLGARWADRVAVSFPGSVDRFRHPERVAVTGNPVRRDVQDLDRAAARTAAAERLGLDPDLPTLLVFGGSQGAQRINDAIIGAHTRWPEPRPQVLHATGKRGFAAAREAWDEAEAARPGGRVAVVEFLHAMADAYAVADVVVCRAGATSIAELTVLGLPAVLVPYPHATADHQRANADALAATGGAVVLGDEALTPAALVAAVAPLLEDLDLRHRMGQAARAFARPDAAGNLARLVLDQLGPRSRP